MQRILLGLPAQIPRRRVGLGEFPLVIAAKSHWGSSRPPICGFLVLFFAFSLLLLPANWYLRRRSGLRFVDRLAQQSDHFWALVVAGLPVALLDTAFHGEQGLAGWNRFSYAVFILYGHVLASDQRFGQAMRRHRKSALVGGIVTFCVVGAVVLGSGRDIGDMLVTSDTAGLVMRGSKALSGWL